MSRVDRHAWSKRDTQIPMVHVPFFSCPSDTFPAPSHLSFFYSTIHYSHGMRCMRQPSLAPHGSQDRLVSTTGPYVESLLFLEPGQSVDLRANTQYELAYASVRTRWPAK